MPLIFNSVYCYRVVFYFKSSKKSNNGTDVNAGQIPQLLYRVVTPESQTPNRQTDHAEPVYILCRDFSRAVNRVSCKLSADCMNLRKNSCIVSELKV